MFLPFHWRISYCSCLRRIFKCLPRLRIFSKWYKWCGAELFSCLAWREILVVSLSYRTTILISCLRTIFPLPPPPSTGDLIDKYSLTLPKCVDTFFAASYAAANISHTRLRCGGFSAFHFACMFPLYIRQKRHLAQMLQFFSDVSETELVFRLLKLNANAGLSERDFWRS